MRIAHTLDKAAKAIGINFIGGLWRYGAKGAIDAATLLIKSIPDALSEAELVCSSVNVASTKAGINMDAIAEMGGVIKKQHILHATAAPSDAQSSSY